MMNTGNLLLLLGLLLSSNDGGLAFTLRSPLSTSDTRTLSSARGTQLEMMQPSLDSSTDEDIISRRQRRPPQELRAIAIDTMSRSDQDEEEEDISQLLAFTEAPTSSSSTTTTTVATEVDSGSFILQVLSAASLVTGSTVGASMLVLPTLAAGPGLGLSSVMFLAVYLVVLTSGLVIADVAINQHESGYDVPSSFQEFAQANLGDSEWIAKLISAVPIVVNSLVMIFDIGKGGEIGAAALAPYSLEIDPIVGSFGFVAILGTCLSTLSGTKLSAVASMCVSTLLLAFGGLLLPGLASVQDPMGTIMAPGTEEEWMTCMISAAPIVLTALQFQNVVPSVAKILGYDRTKTVTAIVLGSFTPLLMYLAWTYAVLGGGIDTAGVAGPLFSIFSASAVFGSATGAGMSVTEEVETTLRAQNNNNNAMHEEKAEVFSFPAVLISLSIPMIGVLAWDDVNVALGIAGSFGSPLLYGVIPALMAWNQRQKADAVTSTKPVVPGGLASVGALGLASTVYIGGGLVQQVTGVLS